MLTIRHKDAYRELIADADKAIHQHNKTVDTINDFEWGYDRFNQRMIDLYPTAYPVKTFDISSRQLTNMKRGVKK
tara:strand:- start:588 stop:812 length:225 start_codon:yes stop_codon:yes gene_type:complete